MAVSATLVGIKAIDIYVPSQCVHQADLEKHDGVASGKYTVGLGQTKMSFCDDREDICSMALSVVSSLLKKYKIDPRTIGRLEVGTETILDKSKSVKSVLMQLFADSGNTNIEGVDNVNACYGGTNAVFNAVNWVESSAWDGRDAIVVAGDIAHYKKGSARPTGGAGCVAMLIGSEAPIVFEPGLRGTYMAHVYDFYKPDLASEYPYVDGHYSIRCYTTALDASYRAYNNREELVHNTGRAILEPGDSSKGDSSKAEEVPLDRFDFMIFHSPTCKLVQKSYARLLYNDYCQNSKSKVFASLPEEIVWRIDGESHIDKTAEKIFLNLSQERFGNRVHPSTYVANLCGNMYCGSVWAGLISLISRIPSDGLSAKRVGIFSYGSGLASSFFSLQIKGSITEMARKLNLQERLDSREVVSPEVYDEICDLREEVYLRKSYKPRGSLSKIADGTYYLEEIDQMFRRHYVLK